LRGVLARTFSPSVVSVLWPEARARERRADLHGHPMNGRSRLPCAPANFGYWHLGEKHSQVLKPRMEGGDNPANVDSEVKRGHGVCTTAIFERFHRVAIGVVSALQISGEDFPCAPTAMPDQHPRPMARDAPNESWPITARDVESALATN